MATSSSEAAFKRILLLLTAAFAFLSAANATQIMRRPASYNGTRHEFPVEKNPTINRIASNEVRATGGRVNAAYFTNWSIYGAGFNPKNVPASDLTHIIYAFADVDQSSGALKLSDPDGDTVKHFDGDSWTEPGNNVYGCIKQMYLHKLANRNLKVLLSVGGWTYSQSGHFNFVTNAGARTTFVNSAIQFIKDYGFDGIDIDFEFPSNSDLGNGFAELITSTRSALNSLASSNGDSVPYELTIAVSAGATNYQNLVVPKMNAALSYWNLMAYDYAGSWDSISGHQSNVYGPSTTGFSTDAALTWYLNNGASANKIALGMPMYGRAFESTDGMGKPYSGIGPGTIEAGVYSYKFLPMSGAQVFEDSSLIASYSYDSAKKELVTYDTPNIVKKKTQYGISKNLAGNFFWEMAQDKTGADSLSKVSHNALGALDQTQNHIKYPNSKYDNIKNNMGGGTTTPPTGGDGCGGVAAWSAGSVYTGGQKASYNGHLWTAKWWTQGETPGKADVWTDSGAC
jgi:chitinase